MAHKPLRGELIPKRPKDEHRTADVISASVKVGRASERYGVLS